MTEESSKIEETLAHQEQQIQDLSDVLIKQSREIESLRAQLAKLQGKVDVIQHDMNAPDEGRALSVSEQAARDKPPHY